MQDEDVGPDQISAEAHDQTVVRWCAEHAAEDDLRRRRAEDADAGNKVLGWWREPLAQARRSRGRIGARAMAAGRWYVQSLERDLEKRRADLVIYRKDRLPAEYAYRMALDGACRALNDAYRVALDDACRALDDAYRVRLDDVIAAERLLAEIRNEDPITIARAGLITQRFLDSLIMQRIINFDKGDSVNHFAVFCRTELGYDARGWARVHQGYDARGWARVPQMRRCRGSCGGRRRPGARRTGASAASRGDPDEPPRPGSGPSHRSLDAVGLGHRGG
jgi:hypothetical protein